jgi:phosphate acetyltransferase
MSIISAARQRIAGKKMKLVMPEGGDARVLEAAERLRAADLADVILFPQNKVIPSNKHIECIVEQRPKLTAALAQRLLEKPLYLAGAMVACGDAQAMLAGAENTTAKVVEAALMTVGLAEGINTPSSFFLMQWPEQYRTLIFADCAVNVQPTAAQLADIAVASTHSASRLLPEAPRVAMLSFSTKGSAKHPDVEKITEALAMARDRLPGVMIDGEYQADTALSPAAALKKLPGESPVGGKANTLIFPDLDAGNIAYKLVQQLSGAQAIGPILQGFEKPVSDLSRNATVDEIVATATLLLAMSLGPLTSNPS